MPSTNQYILNKWENSKWNEKLITAENNKVLGFDSSCDPQMLTMPLQGLIYLGTTTSTSTSYADVPNSTIALTTNQKIIVELNGYWGYDGTNNSQYPLLMFNVPNSSYGRYTFLGDNSSNVLTQIVSSYGNSSHVVTGYTGATSRQFFIKYVCQAATAGNFKLQLKSSANTRGVAIREVYMNYVLL